MGKPWSAFHFQLCVISIFSLLNPCKFNIPIVAVPMFLSAVPIPDLILPNNIIFSPTHGNFKENNPSKTPAQTSVFFSIPHYHLSNKTEREREYAPNDPNGPGEPPGYVTLLWEWLWKMKDMKGCFKACKRYLSKVICPYNFGTKEYSNKSCGYNEVI
ncbi:unnamed protein product [Prunus armeniaca]|uniref:Uncharacterized protein n=1 Tax=Prunus armeniaca TaxID=36596 RepID=A0A6J5VAA4_PRUAR|nr:unnamed protein product [Prunus armeniaca]